MVAAGRYFPRLAISRRCCSGFVISNCLIGSWIAVSDPMNRPRWRINVISHLWVVFAGFFVAINLTSIQGRP